MTAGTPYPYQPDPAWPQEPLLAALEPRPEPDESRAASRHHHLAEIRRKRYLLGYISLLAAGVLLLSGLIWGNYLLTLHVARAAAVEVEHIRAQALQRSRQAQERAAVPECRALRTLEGIPGHPSTTYGQELKRGFSRVYRHSGCPAILRKYGKPIRKARSVS